jgi:SsrA-binding protein
MANQKNIKIIAKNKKAYFDYFIEDKYEVGIALKGTEVKSCRAGKVNLKESYASVDDGEVWVKQMHISPYEMGNIFNVDPERARKLLMHKSEINSLIGKIKLDGLTLIPTMIYFSGGKVKLELGLARGKKNYDKRHTIAERDDARRIERALKNK